MKKEIILLLAAVFILSQGTVLAETEKKKTDKKTQEEGADQHTPILHEAAKITTTIVETPLKLVEGTLGFDLGQLIITPTKYEKYLKDITVSASVADEKDFERGVFKDVSEPLDRINSVRIERFGTHGQSASPVIRGLTGSRILVLINGIPHNAPSLGNADLSKIMMGKVERIEVVRGPYSSLYGADAVGGVINIITKKIPEETVLNISYSYGSWNTHNLTIENGSTHGKLGYNVILDYLFTDGARIHSDHNALDLTSNLKWDIADEVSYNFYTNYYLSRTEHPGPQPAFDQNNRTATENILGNEAVYSLFDYSRTNRINLNSTLNIKNFTANHYFIYWNDDDHSESIDW
ncbi:MAG: TonB-dependent receptor plug domain-containing protein, partial [Candidatus Omnitrophota bacterium]